MTNSASDGVSRALSPKEGFCNNRNCGMVCLVMDRKPSPRAAANECQPPFSLARQPVALDEGKGIGKARKSAALSSTGLDKA